ncbi:MAG: sigma-70 family RNA polymerase sigma factor [Myxococcales bacterium]|nr:sigma-70 family RNA polymerase sigma factor [Myxococcales bacterium]MDH3485165.1 sigma-70 family RNA polymerase sigma factor [Myxococcales bacterium]
MQTGDAFIAQHEKMVHGLAARVRRELSFHGDLDDLVAFGFGGLLEAQYRFDPARGVRFQTFAYHRVRGAMLDGVRKMTHLPRRAHERLRKSAETPPTALPKAAATPLDKVFARVSAGLTTAGPLHGSLGEESPESTLLKNESVARLLAAIAGLSDRQRTLVRGYYFEGRSIDDIAHELGISKSWASRIHTSALAELRFSLEA